MGSGAEPAGSGGVLKCTCFHLPCRSKKKKPPPAAPLVTTKLIGSAGSRSAVEAPAASAAARSPRVTFLASASLSTWWPSSPSGAASADGPAPAAPNIGNVIAPGRVSTSLSAARNGLPRASSFSHWRRSVSSRRVMPHDAAARASFSFPTSPPSASSSCMSTPKIPQGCQR